MIAHCETKVVKLSHKLGKNKRHGIISSVTRLPQKKISEIRGAKCILSLARVRTIKALCSRIGRIGIEG